jgi:hypothetical protein
LHYSVEFAPSLKGNDAYKLPWSKKSTSKIKPSGTVTSTSREDLDKTISKALAQARLLGLTEFAATVLDVCIERLEGFTETVLTKK